MNYTIKCPLCNEINSGSNIYCVKCRTKLVRIQQKNGTSTMDNSEIKKTDRRTSKATKKNSNTHAKIGLIVGIIGFFVISFFTFGGSCCAGLFISIGMGLVSGFLTVHYTNIETADDVSRLGATSGGLAGVFALLGQQFGTVLPFIIFGVFQALNLFPDRNSNMTNGFSAWIFLPSSFNGILGLIASSMAGAISAERTFRKTIKESYAKNAA